MRTNMLRAGNKGRAGRKRWARRHTVRMRPSYEPLEARLALTAGLPLAVNDLVATGIDQPLELEAAAGVLANDVGSEGATLAANLFSGPQHGTLDLRPDGSLTYVPASGFEGLDSFLYYATDGEQPSALAAVTIRVEGSPPSPQAVDDLYTLPEEGTLDVGATHGVLANDQFLGSGATAQLVQGPAHGTLTLAAHGGLVYQPAPGFFGTDSFLYEVVTASGQRSTATVSLEVTPVNDPPQAVNDQFTTSAGRALTLRAEQGLLANDSDPEGDALTVTWVAPPEHGILQWQPDGSLSYTPQPGFTGRDGFRYRVSDGTDESGIAAVTILVTPQNTAPVAVNDELATDEDQPLVLSAPGVLANDQDAEGDPLAAVLVNPPRFGTLTLGADGGLVYTPAADFFGVDGFSYLAGDGQDTSAAAGVTIVVRPVADPPRPGEDAYQTLAGQTLVVEAAAGVLANDSDPDGDSLAAALAQPPAHGTLSLAEDGSFVYVPEAGFVGSDQFVYEVSDGTHATAATVRIEVASPQNLRPEAVNDQFTLLAGSVLTVAAPDGLLHNDFDPEGQPLQASLFAPPLFGQLSLAADGSLTYTPNPGFQGVDAFLYRVSDGTLASALAAVTLYVEPSTPAPPSEAGDPGAPAGETSSAAGLALAATVPEASTLSTVACQGGHRTSASSEALETAAQEPAFDEESAEAFAAAVDALWSTGLAAV